MDRCHLVQHEELLKPRQVLLGSISLNTPIQYLSRFQQIPHFVLQATINCIFCDDGRSTLMINRLSSKY